MRAGASEHSVVQAASAPSGAPRGLQAGVGLITCAREFLGVTGAAGRVYSSCWLMGLMPSTGAAVTRREAPPLVREGRARRARSARRVTASARVAAGGPPDSTPASPLRGPSCQLGKTAFSPLSWPARRPPHLGGVVAPQPDGEGRGIGDPHEVWDEQAQRPGADDGVEGGDGGHDQAPHGWGDERESVCQCPC